MTLDWSLMRGPGACSLFGCWAMCKLHSYSGTLRADYSWLLDWNVLGLRGSSWSVGTSWLCRLWFCCWFLGKNKSIQTYYKSTYPLTLTALLVSYKVKRTSQKMPLTLYCMHKVCFLTHSYKTMNYFLSFNEHLADYQFISAFLFNSLISFAE